MSDEADGDPPNLDGAPHLDLAARIAALEAENAALTHRAQVAERQIRDQENLSESIRLFHRQAGLPLSEYYRYYLDASLPWPEGIGEWLVCACLDENGIRCWPGDGVGIISGLIHQRSVAARNAQNALAAARVENAEAVTDAFYRGARVMQERISTFLQYEVSLSWGIDDWIKMTKKEITTATCTECAKAVANLRVEDLPR